MCVCACVHVCVCAKKKRVTRGDGQTGRQEGAHTDAPTHTDRQTHTCTRKHTHAHTISLFVCLSFPCLVTTRFVPDDMTFDEEARSSATDVPAGNYAPLDFTTQALQQSNVELTWDGDDARRVELTRRQ